MTEEWENVSEMDQAIAGWKEALMTAGINLDDEEVCWIVAVTIERVFALVVSNMEDCPYLPHVVEHLQYGLAPIIMTVDSALTRHDSA